MFLNPGELYFGSGDVRVETLLGPCVAIVLWFPGVAKGGMCHFQLPGLDAPASSKTDGRYGVDAWRWLTQQVSQHGLALALAQIKLFGGARSINRSGLTHALDVAAQNVAFVEALLAAQSLPVLARDLGGEGYRYVRFELMTGDVWVRRGAAMSIEIPEVKR